MSKARDTAQLLQEAGGLSQSQVELERLDQIHDLHRLMGQVLALKTLLDLMTNSEDERVRRQSASDLLKYTGEDPSTVADRLRKSVFADLSVAELEELVDSKKLPPGDSDG